MSFLRFAAIATGLYAAIGLYNEQTAGERRTLEFRPENGHRGARDYEVHVDGRIAKAVAPDEDKTGKGAKGRVATQSDMYVVRGGVKQISVDDGVRVLLNGVDITDTWRVAEL